MSTVEIVEASGSTTFGLLLAALLTLGCFLYATGVFALIRDVHRSRMAVVRRATRTAPGSSSWGPREDMQ